LSHFYPLSLHDALPISTVTLILVLAKALFVLSKLRFAVSKSFFLSSKIFLACCLVGLVLTNILCISLVAATVLSAICLGCKSTYILVNCTRNLDVTSVVVLILFYCISISSLFYQLLIHLFSTCK